MSSLSVEANSAPIETLPPDSLAIDLMMMQVVPGLRWACATLAPDMLFRLLLLAALADSALSSRVEKDAIYAMRGGLAMLMDVHFPERSKGLGIIFIPGRGRTRRCVTTQRLSRNPDSPSSTCHH